MELYKYWLNCCNKYYTKTGYASFCCRWRFLWSKLKKMFDFSTDLAVQVPYDPYTYSKNFDQGSTWDDPDSISRSFSARFALPSTNKA